MTHISLLARCTPHLGKLALPLILAASASAQVNISGNISDLNVGPFLTGTVYRITSTVTVPAGETLTIQPGAIIKANAARHFLVNGTLLVQGTPGQHVVFTSILDDTVGGDTGADGATSGAAGDWRGLQFQATSVNSVIDYADVRYAGNFSFGGIEIFAPTSLDNCTIRDCSQEGINLNNTLGSTVSNCTIENNGGIAVENVQLMSVPSFTGNSASGNGGNYLEVLGTAPSADVSIVAGNCLGGALYCSTSITIPTGVTVTMGAGVVTKWAAARHFIFNGTLIANGTALDPVEFTSFTDDSLAGDTNGDGLSSGAPGYWRGLDFLASSTGSSLQHTNIRYAGNFNFAGIEVFAPISLDECSIRDCLQEGLNLNNTLGTTVSNCTIDNNGGIAVENAPLMAVPDFTGSSISGNAGNYIEVLGTAPTADVTIMADNCLGGALYFTTSMTVPVGVTVTLGPGVVTKWGAARHFLFNGTLVAAGTEAEPVVFTSFTDDSIAGDTNGDGAMTVAAPGYWRGIDFLAASTGNDLDYAIIQYAGNFNFASIEMNGPSEASITNCTIRSSLQEGLNLQSANKPALTIENCCFEDNGGIAVENVPVDMVPNFLNNTATGNGGNYMEVVGTAASQSITIAPENVLGGALVFTATLTVPVGVQWTLLPGVVIKFTGARQLLFNGGLDVPAGAEPVVFTDFRDDSVAGDTNGDGASTGLPAWWRGVNFLVGAAASLVENLTVRYAGNFNLPGVTNVSPLVALAGVRVEHCSADGFELSASSGDANHLVAYDCGAKGIDLVGGSFDLDHVTVYGSGGDGIVAGVSWSGEVQNSISWGNTADNFDSFVAGEVRYSNGSPVFVGSDGNIDEDPLFVDAANGDLTLMFDSPCIDTGNPASPLDFDQTRTDMGAYPFNQCEPRVYCVAALNSNGTGGSIGSTGTSSVSANDFSLTLSSAVPGQPVLAYYGPVQVQFPFGDGFRCVGGAFRLNPPTVSDMNGDAVRPIDWTSAPSNSGPGEVLPGDVWNFQWFYRDPLVPGGTGFNMSEALTMRMCP